MKNVLLRGVFRPLIERLGTMLAAYMIARGFDSDLTAQLMNALVAALFVGLDLVTAAMGRHYDETKLLGEFDRPHRKWEDD
ncbi:hypothetical protein ACFFTN_15505 [Aminobacter aganoensis]|uniref:Uncharacterized protein n=1 Tax=Aminobacter aganoensis TaxID=83264 RepID=A0A7X0FBD7_9HYPH|nr:hypothetical protein [Aminobacter aganoensis]MBB6356284.1 hypothetical protein [Aminobacter aganoensis]